MYVLLYGLVILILVIYLREMKVYVEMFIDNLNVY